MKFNVYTLRICISVPLAGDRVTEAGVEEIIKMERGRGVFPPVPAQSRLKYHLAVPLIVVFTKYDQLVGVAIYNAPAELDDDEAQSYGEKKASKAFKELCVDPLQETVGNVLLSKVSSGCHRVFKTLHSTTDTSFHAFQPSHYTDSSLNSSSK
jgi:hypothetical protein